MSVHNVIPGISQPLARKVEFVSTVPAVRRRYPHRIVCNLLAICEAALIASVVLALFSTPGGIADWSGRYLLLGCTAIGAVALFSSLATGSGSAERFASRMALLPCASVTAGFTVFFAILGGVNWLYALLGGAIIFVTIYLAKIFSLYAKAWLVAKGYIIRHVAVAADDVAHRQSLVELLRARDDIRIVFVGSPGALEVLDELTQSGQLDEIVLAGHEEREEDIAALMGLAVTLVRVTPQDRVLYRNAHDRWGRKRIFGSWDAPASVIATPPLQGWNAAIKRAMDIFGSLAALLLFGPIIVVVAVLIRLESPGPALFVQERVGYRNKSFRMYKLRSMRSDMADKTGAQLTLRDDPRVTRIGAFIRKTSIDELPQLFNVLLGDMSLVGPRPHPKAAKAGTVLYDDLIPNFYSRYRMKPGITGLAQVKGLRGNTETEQHLIDRFGSDLQYAAEWTPLLDIAIILRTTVHVFTGTNAY